MGHHRLRAARTRALSVFQAATAGGATAGIVLGGLLTSYIGWRAIFLVNPPIIAVLAVAVPRPLPRDAGQDRTRLDVAGAVLATMSVTSLIYGLSEGEDHGFAAPMLPFAIFADPARRAALAAIARSSRLTASTQVRVTGGASAERFPNEAAVVRRADALPATCTTSGRPPCNVPGQLRRARPS